MLIKMMMKAIFSKFSEKCTTPGRCWKRNNMSRMSTAMVKGRATTHCRKAAKPLASAAPKAKRAKRNNTSFSFLGILNSPYYLIKDH